MTYPQVPPQPGVPRRPRWPVRAALAALVLATVASATTGWYLYTRVIRKDAGIAVCKVLREDAVDGNDDNTDSDFTRSDYAELRDAFEASRHDDVRVAGTRFADVFWQATQSGAGSVRSGDRDQLVSAMADLQGACANHDVVITIDWSE